MARSETGRRGTERLDTGDWRWNDDPPRSRRGGRGGRGPRALWIIPLTILALIGIGVYAGIRWLENSSIFHPEQCVATSPQGQVTISPEQASNAAVISAVGIRRELPQRAVTIAIATAMQESKLQNLAGGDRDSIGLFQQRPSMGWGTPDEIMDPVYASGRFYSALVRVPDYASIPLTDAAQAVQHSGAPDAYATHEASATVLSDSLVGAAPATLACAIDSQNLQQEQPAADGLTPRADAVRAAVQNQYGTGASASGSGGLTVTIATSSNRRGWSYAQWAVAQAKELGIDKVTFAGKSWSRSHADSWRDESSASSGHVTITVVKNS